MEHPAPTVGRTVLFVLHEGPSAGQIRSAVITRVWRQPEDKSPVRGGEVVQLTVNLDGSNDLPRPKDSLANAALELCYQIERSGASRERNEVEKTYATHLAVSSAHYDPTGKTPRTWHWPPRG